MYLLFWSIYVIITHQITRLWSTCVHINVLSTSYLSNFTEPPHQLTLSPRKSAHKEGTKPTNMLLTQNNCNVVRLKQQQQKTTPNQPLQLYMSQLSSCVKASQKLLRSLGTSEQACLGFFNLFSYVWLFVLTCKRTKFGPIMQGTYHHLQWQDQFQEKLLQFGGSIFLLPTGEQGVSLWACKFLFNKHILKTTGAQHLQYLMG